MSKFLSGCTPKNKNEIMELLRNFMIDNAVELLHTGRKRKTIQIK